MLIKFYRTVLRNIPIDSANQTHKNFYFKRLDAMEVVKNEYRLQISKSLGIVKAVVKGLGL